MALSDPGQAPPVADVEWAGRRARARRIGIGAGVAVCATLVTTFVLLGRSPRNSGAEPTATKPPASPTTPAHAALYTPAPMPTRSWPPLPLPTGVSPSLNDTLDRIGPSLGVPAGTRFTYIDLGGSYKGVDAVWGKQGDPPRVWGNISIDSAATVSKEAYSCANLINCVEVTGADGSMTYVAGPIVGRAPSAAAPTGAPPLPPDPRLLGHGTYAPRDFVYSYHPDGTFVMITISPEIEPATLTIAQLVAAGLAFSAVS